MACYRIKRLKWVDITNRFGGNLSPYYAAETPWWGFAVYRDVSQDQWHWAVYQMGGEMLYEDLALSKRDAKKQCYEYFKRHLLKVLTEVK